MNTIQTVIQNSHILLNWYDVSLSSSKSDFIDPFSVVVVLALLKYKPLGTKLHIGKSMIKLDEAKLGQSLIRTIYRNRKEDLKRIYQPLIYACKYFLAPDHTSLPDPSSVNQGASHVEDLRRVFALSVVGLRNLKQTYKGYDDITNMLNIYINIIDRSVSEYDSIMCFLEDLLKLSEPVGVPTCEQSFGSTTSSSTAQTTTNLKKMIEMKKNIYDQFNSIWSPTRIAIVTHMFKELDTKMDSERANMIQSIEAVLCDCNQDIQNLLKNLSE